MDLLLVFAGALLVAVLVSERAERTVLSTAVVFLVAGVLLGRSRLGSTAGVGMQTLSLLSQLALFSVLFTDGMRAGGEAAPPGSRKLVVRALLVGMPLTIVGIAAVARYVVGLSWLEALLLGSILSPTDPIFISAVFAFKAVPERLKRMLNVESGINDGIALPLVVIFLGELSRRRVGLTEVFWDLVAGLAIGVVIPWLGIRLEQSRFFGASRRFLPLNAFALGLLVLAVSWRLGVNIFLAAFAAGISVARMNQQLRASFQGFGELVAELLKLGAILAFGLEAAPNLLNPLDWRSIVFVGMGLFGVRLLAIWVAMLGSGLPSGEVWAAGWFGPKGFGSVVYGLMILEAGIAHADTLAHLVAVTITLSILLYSSTDILVGRWFEKQSSR